MYVSCLRILAGRWSLPALIAIGAIEGRSQGTTGEVVGIVRDSTGAPVPGARVVRAADGLGQRAAADGRFRLTLAAGRTDLVVSAVGFAPVRRRVDVPSRETVQVEIVLARSVLSLTGLTVTAAPMVSTLSEVAAPASVLSQSELTRSLGATLGATLAHQPGIHLRSQGPAAAMPIIRGLTGDRIVVMQDGQRTSDLAGSAPDHGVTIDPLAAREVEVVRGPAALLYGTNALGGIINVISDDIPRVIPDRRLVSLNLTAGTAARGGATLLDVVQPLGRRTALTVKAGGRSHDNLLVGGDHAALDNTSARNRTLVTGVGHVDARRSGGVAWRRHEFEYGLPTRDGPTSGVRLRGGREEVSVRGEAEGAGPVARMRVDGTAQWYRHDEIVATGEVGTGLGLATQQLQLLGSLRPSGPLRAGAVGASVLRRRNAVSGPQALTPPNESRVAGVVAFQEFAIGRGVTVPASWRVEDVRVGSDATGAFGPAVDRRFRTWSASVGAVRRVGPGASLAVNVARAVRPPAAEELFSRAGHAGTGAFEVGNPGLAPEVTVGTDILWRVERRDIRAEVAAFRSTIDGWIGMYPTGRDTTIAAPGGQKVLPLHAISQRDARILGAEAQVERTMGRALVLGVMADVVRARDHAGDALPFMPTGRLGATARWDGPRWQLGGLVRRVAAQRIVAPGEWRAPGYAQADAFIGVRVLAGPAVHHILLRMENAGDRLIRDAASRTKDFAPGAGRNVSLTWRLTF